MGRQKRFLELTLIVVSLAAIVLSVGFTNKKGGTTNSATPLNFERTVARLERGRYIVEGPAHCFDYNSRLRDISPSSAKA